MFISVSVFYGTFLKFLMYVCHHEQVGIESIIISFKKLVCELPALVSYLPLKSHETLWVRFSLNLFTCDTIIIYKTHLWLNIYFKDIIKCLMLNQYISISPILIAVSQKLDVSADLSILSWHKICFIQNINIEFHICS